LYLSCNSIKNGNYAWQAATESNPNQTCQNNTKYGKEDIECQKHHSQPPKIQNQRSLKLFSAKKYCIVIMREREREAIGSTIYLKELWFYCDNRHRRIEFTMTR